MMNLFGCFFAILLLIQGQGSAAKTHYGLRHAPKKSSMRGHKGSARRKLILNPPKKSGRLGSKIKVCGKPKGKGGGRRLFPCVEYGDPGDDPIDRDADGDEEVLVMTKPVFPPTTAPSTDQELFRGASGSNKDTDFVFEYEPYKVSGSNDRKPDFDYYYQDRVPTDDIMDNNGIIDLKIRNDEEGTVAPIEDDEDLDIFKTDDNVPSNDVVPSNDH
jgi:hypothetical protein